MHVPSPSFLLLMLPGPKHEVRLWGTLHLGSTPLPSLHAFSGIGLLMVLAFAELVWLNPKLNESWEPEPTSPKRFVKLG